MELLLLFFLLAGYAVKCDESNYYVIQMPEEIQSPPLQVYWNVPTMQCTSKKVPFESLHRFGILQNKNDSFRGETVSIMYDPGIFPALFRNESSGHLRFRNGGVPQEGDLDHHIKSFRSVLDQSIPDPEFSGIGIIDFESWRPILRQNFGDVFPYKAISYEIERNKHWWWPETWIQQAAKKRFEEAAQTFMQTTLEVAKQMRPKARWGYYGFPYCFNMANSNMNERCAKNVNSENDQIDWLWKDSTALYPSVYSHKNLSSTQLSQLIRGRVKEAARLRRRNTPILPYFWFRYKDGGFLSQEDLNVALKTFNRSEAAGFIIWGSSNDVSTVEKCKLLLNYINNVMGPAIARYTLNLANDEKLHDDNNIGDTNDIKTKPVSTSNDTETVELEVNITTSKPIFDLSFIISQTNEDIVSTTENTINVNRISLENSIKDINRTDTTKAVLNKLNETVLTSMILNNVVNNSKNHDKVLILDTNIGTVNSNLVTTDTTESITDIINNNSNTETSTHKDIDENTTNSLYGDRILLNHMSETPTEGPNLVSNEYQDQTTIAYKTKVLVGSTDKEYKEIIKDQHITTDVVISSDFTTNNDNLDTTAYSTREITQELDRNDDNNISEKEKQYFDLTYNYFIDSNLETSTHTGTDIDINRFNEKANDNNVESYTLTSKEFGSTSLSTDNEDDDEETTTDSNLYFNQESFFNPSVFGEFSDPENDTKISASNNTYEEYADLSTETSVDYMNSYLPDYAENIAASAAENVAATETLNVEESYETVGLHTRFNRDKENVNSNKYENEDSRKGVPRSTNEDLLVDPEFVEPSTATEQVLVMIA